MTKDILRIANSTIVFGGIYDSVYVWLCAASVYVLGIKRTKPCGHIHRTEDFTGYTP
jgi:hypothetical protein